MGIQQLVERRLLSRIAVAKDLAEKEFIESDYDLKSATTELAAKNWKWAIIKGYYAMFHAAKAVLFLMGLKEQAHFAVTEVLDILSKDGKLESRFVNNFKATMFAREGADYHYKHPQHIAEEIVDIANGFVERMKKLAKTIGA